MELLYLMMKKLQKHSINIFVTLLKTCHYQKVLLLRSPQLNSLLTLLYLHWKKYKDHPSITSIKSKMTSRDNPKFSFTFVSLNETLNGVNKLNRKKASQATDIPVKIIKENKDVISFSVFHNFKMHYQVALFQLH